MLPVRPTRPVGGGEAMFYSSTQRRYWTFRSEDELARSRADANRKFRSKAVAGGKVRRGAGAGWAASAGPLGERGGAGPGLFRSASFPQVHQGDSFLLEAHEELAICKYYEKRLLDFCAVFKPAMPRSVVVSRSVLSRGVPRFLTALPSGKSVVSLVVLQELSSVGLLGPFQFGAGVHRIAEWFGLEGLSKPIRFDPSPCVGRAAPPAQATQGSIQPGPENLPCSCARASPPSQWITSPLTSHLNHTFSLKPFPLALSLMGHVKSWFPFCW